MGLIALSWLNFKHFCLILTYVLVQELISKVFSDVSLPALTGTSGFKHCLQFTLTFFTTHPVCTDQTACANHQIMLAH